MKSQFLSAAIAVVILAISAVNGAHSATRVQEPGAQTTADPNRQNLQPGQAGKSAEAAEPKQTESVPTNSARAKAIRRAYAIRARTAKQKKQLAKSKKPSLKSKKKVAT